MKDYDCDIKYHPGKANVVADALSRKVALSKITAQKELQQELLKEEIEVVIEICGRLEIRSTLLEEIKRKQKEDKCCQEIQQQMIEGKQTDFQVVEGVLRFKGRVCVPQDMELRNKVLFEAHNTLYTAHPGGVKMYQDLKKNYWWLGMRKEVESYVAKCLTCQQVKAEHQRPSGTLQPLSIPEWKWEDISMDFIVGLPKVQRGYNALWVIVDRLSKSAHFIPIKDTTTSDQLGQIYVKEIVRLHGVPKVIVSDRDARFTAAFWNGLQKALGTRVSLSTAYHPQTDGQTERTNQVIEDMLRACCMDHKANWNDILPLVEFAYNNSYQATIKMAPYEALYGRKCRSPLHWDELGEKQSLESAIGPEMTQKMIEDVRLIRERMKQAQDRQKSYADLRRKELEFQVSDKVFVKVAPYKHVMRFGKKGKLAPRYIGPFEVLQRVGRVAYRLALPPSLDKVHDVFHVSLLRKYVSDPSHVLKTEEVELNDNLTYKEHPVQILDRKLKELRNKSIPLVKVLWRNHKAEEATWEVEQDMRSRYPELFP